MIFDRGVILSVGMPAENGAELHASQLFTPQPGESRTAMMVRARVHFQTYLHQLEVLLRKHPYQWFNFTPLNPAVANAPGRKEVA